MSTLTPTAVEPSRVLVLNEDEQNAIIDALYERHRVGDHVAHGHEYVNETDEYVRKTLAKRRLEGEIRRLNIRLAQLEETIVEDWATNARTGETHGPTGATLQMNRRVWAKLDIDTDGLDKPHAEQLRAEAKARVGAVLQEIDETADMVRPDFNLNTLSAYFREQIKQYDAEQRELPEHQRQPRDADSFLPDSLRGLLLLDDTPHIQVRA